MASKVRCQYCGKHCKPQGLKSHEKVCYKKNVATAEVETLGEPSLGEHNEMLDHVLDGVWKGLSLNDKLEAIHGIYFDPSNPED